jgi:hypothetical protein
VQLGGEQPVPAHEWLGAPGWLSHGALP